MDEPQYKNRVIVFMTPNKDGMYFYLNKTKEEAIAAFKEHEDWIFLYAERFGEPEKMHVHDIEFDDDFCLFNIQNEVREWERNINDFFHGRSEE